MKVKENLYSMFVSFIYVLTSKSRPSLLLLIPDPDPDPDPEDEQEKVKVHRNQVSFQEY